MLAPLAAFALARRIREARAWAVMIPVMIATAQILEAIDTQRLVAAAYPFILVASAWELDPLAPPKRAIAGMLVWNSRKRRGWLTTRAPGLCRFAVSRSPSPDLPSIVHGVTRGRHAMWRLDSAQVRR